MSRPRRILVSTFGSAGDLFPLLAAIERLRQEGHDIIVATGRAAGLYLRVAGIRTLALGDGLELRVLNDLKMASSRFDGWEAWRHTVNTYVAPNLAADVARIEKLVRDWQPDLVVAGSFAGAARIAGRNQRLPILDVSVYPQHQRLMDTSGGFARAYSHAAEKLIVPATVADLPVSKWLWGVSPDVLLHDRALLRSHAPELQPIGLSAWDGVPSKPEEERAARDFLQANTPTVVATLGSFMGLSQQQSWKAVVGATSQLGLQALLVGARGRWADETFGSRPDTLCVGFLRLAEHLPHAEVVIHHGGIGTVMATLRAGRPSLVVPQAFDNMFNARLIEQAGVGMASSHDGLSSDLGTVLDRADLASTAVALGASLIPSAVSADALAIHAVRAAEAVAA